MWAESGRFAAALARDGIGPGDRVALYLPNCPAYPIALLGVLRLGAVVVQVSPLYIGQDLTRILKDSTPKAIVTLEILYPNLEKVRADYTVPVLCVARLREFYPVWTRPFVNLVLRKRGMPTSYPRHDPGVRPWTWTVHYRGTAPTFHGDPATTVAVLQYTGGTTGRSEGGDALASEPARQRDADQRVQHAARPGPRGHPRLDPVLPHLRAHGRAARRAHGGGYDRHPNPSGRARAHQAHRPLRPDHVPGGARPLPAFIHTPGSRRYNIRSITVLRQRFGAAPARGGQAVRVAHGWNI